MYRKVLRLLNSEPAFYRGTFFDVMYVNFNNPRFSPHHNYAFLRHADDTTIVVAVNFSGEAKDLEIKMPELAFEVMGIEPASATATDLISGRRLKKTLSPDAPFITHIGPWGAVAWKFQKNCK